MLGSNYAALNRSTVQLVKTFVDWKRPLGDAQAKVKICSSCARLLRARHPGGRPLHASRLDQLARGSLEHRLLGEDYGGPRRIHRHLPDLPKQTLIAA